MQAAPVGARCRLGFFFLRCSSFPRLLLMRVLPSIEYMLRFFPISRVRWPRESGNKICFTTRHARRIITSGFVLKQGELTMAASQNILELGGYDFEFTSVVTDYFKCPVCRLTVKDPMQIGGCGHRLCNICLGSLLR